MSARAALRYLRKSIRPRLGRLAESQLQFLGSHLAPPAFLAWGPFLVLVDLPKRLQKRDPEVSIFDLNAALRQIHQEIQDGVIDLGNLPPR